MENLHHKETYDCITCERKSHMFKMLSDDELRLVRANRVHILYKEGEVIQKQGTFMSHVISINSGLAKIYLEGENHENTILRIVKPTNFIGGPGIFYDQLHHFSILAMKNTSVCLIEMQVFKQLLDQNKAFAAEFMKDYSKNVISVYNRLMSLTQKQLAGRLADAILYLFEEVYENEKKVIRASRQDLTELSAISRDSSARILREFQNEDIIRINGNELELINPETLRLVSKIG